MSVKKLNLGCGFNILPGWVNLDITPADGVDVVFDLETCRQNRIPLEDGSVDQILCSHVLEHISDILPLMEELYRIASPDCMLTIRVPHASSDDAFGDPTHVRFFVADSFYAFGQPYYWRASYGYQADWQITDLQYTMQASKEELEDATQDSVMKAIYYQRNQIAEMVATLHARKPAREASKQILDASVIKPRVVARKRKG